MEEHLLDTPGIVADGGPEVDADAQICEHRADIRRIGINDLAEQQFGSDRDHLGAREPAAASGPLRRRRSREIPHGDGASPAWNVRSITAPGFPIGPSERPLTMTSTAPAFPTLTVIWRAACHPCLPPASMNPSKTTAPSATARTHERSFAVTATCTAPAGGGPVSDGPAGGYGGAPEVCGGAAGAAGAAGDEGVGAGFAGAGGAAGGCAAGGGTGGWTDGAAGVCGGAFAGAGAACSPGAGAFRDDAGGGVRANSRTCEKNTYTTIRSPTPTTIPAIVSRRRVREYGVAGVMTTSMGDS